MRLETVRVGGTTVRPRMAYGAQARFGRATTVGPRYFIGGVILIMAVAFVLRVWNLGEASLWTDEALTAVRAQAPFNESLASLMAAGNQSPFYFWSLRLVPNSTETLLRLPSALLGLLGIGLMIFIVMQLYRDREMALWVGAVLAVNPFHVWLSRTARPYSMLFVLALLISYFFLMLLRGNRSRTMWIGFTISSLFAYSTHFTAMALPGSQLALFALIASPRQKRALFRHWIMAQTVAVVPTIFWLYVVLRQPLVIGSRWIPQPQLRDLPLTLWNMLLGYDGVFKWHLVPGLMLVTLGLVFGIGYAVGERRTNRVNFCWVLVLVAAMIPVYLMSRYIISIYVDRYFMVILPSLILLMIHGWTRYSRVIWRAALAVVIITGMYTVLFSFYNGSYKRADWRNAASYVATRYQPGDVIMLERSNTREAFSRYFDTDERILDLAIEAPNVVLLYDTPDTTTLEQTSSRMWVIYRNPNEDVHRMGLMPDFDPFDAKLSLMGTWLSGRQNQIIEHRVYNGMRILLVDTQRAMVSESR